MIGVKIGMFVLNSFIKFPGDKYENTKSMLFDSVDEKIDCNHVSALSNTANFSFSLWIKAADIGAVYRILSMYNTTSNWIEMLNNNGKLQMAIRNGDTSNTISTTSVINVGSWMHIAMSYDGGGATNADKVKLWLDGSAVTVSQTGTIPSTTYSFTTEDFYIAAGQGGGVGYFDGNIDEVDIFDYSISSSDVTTIYNSGTPIDTLNTAGLTAPIHRWRMGDGSDTITTINDIGTTGGNDGTPSNMESADIENDVP